MALTEARAQLSSNIAEAIAYGVNIVLFFCTLTLLFTKRERTKVTIAFSCVAVVMFLLTTIHFAAVTAFTFRQFITEPSVPVSPGRIGDPLQVQSVSAAIINASIGDTLVLWRAWCVYGKRIKPISVPLLFWLTGLVTGVISICMTAIPRINSSPTSDLTWIAIYAVMIFVTNAWTVGMFGLVYWRYRRNVISVIGPQKALHRVILLFLVDSGALYCITIFVTMLSCGLKLTVYHIVTQISSQLIGMYPMLIILVVHLGLTHQDKLFERGMSSHGLQCSTVMFGQHTSATTSTVTRGQILEFDHLHDSAIDKS